MVMKRIKPIYLEQLLKIIFECPYCGTKQTHFRDVEEELERFNLFSCSVCQRNMEIEFEFVD